MGGFLKKFLSYLETCSASLSPFSLPNVKINTLSLSLDSPYKPFPAYLVPLQYKNNTLSIILLHLPERIIPIAGYTLRMMRTNYA